MRVELPCYLEEIYSEKKGKNYYVVTVWISEKSHLAPIFLNGAELELALERYGNNDSKKIKLDINKE